MLLRHLCISLQPDLSSTCFLRRIRVPKKKEIKKKKTNLFSSFLEFLRGSRCGHPHIRAGLRLRRSRSSSGTAAPAPPGRCGGTAVPGNAQNSALLWGSGVSAGLWGGAVWGELRGWSCTRCLGSGILLGRFLGSLSPLPQLPALPWLPPAPPSPSSSWGG